MSTAALAVLEPQELNRTKGFLGTTGEMTAGADPEVLTHIKALSDVELFSLGEKALEDIADQILVLDEIRTRFRNAGGRAILGYASWREFVEKNSRYSIRTVQRRLSEIHGTDDTKVNRPETLAARRKEDHATNVASSDDAPQAPEPTVGASRAA